MDLVTPSIGLIIWQSIIFILLITILGKFAWKPILKIISQREESITLSLKMAKEATQEIEKIKIQKQEMLREISFERNQMIQKTNEIKQELENQAKENAKFQADFILKKAKEEIENQKNLAMAELKNQLADFSLSIAEKLLRKELEEKEKQRKWLLKSVKEL